MRRAVFLDRDGVLNRTIVRDGVPHPPDTPDELEVLPGVPAALAALAARGLALVVVTNQPDVARGTQSRAVVEAINDRLRAQLPLDDILVCYHDTPDGCGCRKPLPGLLVRSAAAHGVDLRRSFMVGDRWSDVEAGRAAGCTTVLIDMPYSRRERCAPDYIAADLPDAAQQIINLIIVGSKLQTMSS